MPAVSRSVDTRFLMPEPVPLTPQASGALDAIRALAALAVMLGHGRAMFLVEYPQVRAELRTAPVQLLYFFSGFGHEAVVVFFVLSGFLISSSVLRDYRRGQWSWLKYGSDRASRLYVVLIPALVLGLLWDLLGTTFFNRHGLYTSPMPEFGGLAPAAGLTVRAVLGDLFFLQIYTGPPGSNGVVWSLFCEFWFYVLFPVLTGAYVALRGNRFLQCAGYAVLAVGAMQILGPHQGEFGLWLLGAAAAVGSRYLRLERGPRWIPACYTFAVAAAFCACMLFSRLNKPWPGGDYMAALIFASTIYGVVQLPYGMNDAAIHLAKRFAGFSYSLYMLHFPMLLLVSAIVLGGAEKWQADPVHLAWWLALSGLALLYSFAVAEVTEKKTPAVRDWLRTRLQR